MLQYEVKLTSISGLVTRKELVIADDLIIAARAATKLLRQDEYVQTLNVSARNVNVADERVDPDSITVQINPIQMHLGDEQPILLTGLTTIPIEQLHFTSSDKTVVEVDGTTLLAVDYGSAYITAIDSDGKFIGVIIQIEVI
jgi:hypothetical protein